MGQTVSGLIQPWIQPWAEYFFDWKLQRYISKLKPEDLRLWEVYDFEGIPLRPDVLPSTMDELKTLEIRQDDVFIVTYTKAADHYISKRISEHGKCTITRAWFSGWISARARWMS
ncbi:uncharacterized protein LOC110979732 [Acanthaster planci]|uniref:Uncharacterized protein LOC110979732 n=1 Tax=Acanthaster planci TaxID=133434 RepID=A0A8B7YIN2_ACAPL|nr:uncharacterized protein LOC110979732 [Acanthaster planci]